MIKLPTKFEVGDLVLTNAAAYWDDEHYQQVVCITEIDWGLELLAVTHSSIEFNQEGIPYHEFRFFKLLSKKSKLSELIYG